MAHRLFPAEGCEYLSALSVVERLRAEFGFVDEDRAAGSDHVGGMIEQFLRMGLPHLRAQISTLQSVRDEAVEIHLADDVSEQALSFVVIPGEPLFVGYSSEQHEQETRSLLERCAGALGYEVELA